jgi:hypothetical protein
VKSQIQNSGMVFVVGEWIMKIIIKTTNIAPFKEKIAETNIIYIP